MGPSPLPRSVFCASDFLVFTPPCRYVVPMTMVASAALLLILVRAAAELCLSQLNAHHVRAHADRIPESYAGTMDDATYAKSINYTLA